MIDNRKLRSAVAALAAIHLAIASLRSGIRLAQDVRTMAREAAEDAVLEVPATPLTTADLAEEALRRMADRKAGRKDHAAAMRTPAEFMQNVQHTFDNLCASLEQAGISDALRRNGERLRDAREKADAVAEANRAKRDDEKGPDQP